MKKINLFKFTLFGSMLLITACGGGSPTSSPSTPTTSEEPTTIEPTTSIDDNQYINVYLIGGQSNAVGFGMDNDREVQNSDSRYRTGFENVLYFSTQERWNGSRFDTEFVPVKIGYGVSTDRSGAEIGIASALGDNGEMNAVIKCAWGATYLYPDYQANISKTHGTWTSPSYIEDKDVDTSTNKLIGRMYSWFEQTLAKGISKLIEDGYTPIIKGMWWMQGESEMSNPHHAGAYKELLTYLINDVRDTVSTITDDDYYDMPFVMGLPKFNNINGYTPPHQDTVRNAMIEVCTEGEVVNADYVDCMPLFQHDDWHFDAAGQKYLGEQFVEKVANFN